MTTRFSASNAAVVALPLGMVVATRRRYALRSVSVKNTGNCGLAMRTSPAIASKATSNAEGGQIGLAVLGIGCGVIGIAAPESEDRAIWVFALGTVIHHDNSQN